MQQAKIRLGKAEDMNDLYRCICELAHYERAPHEVSTTTEQLLADWQQQRFEFMVSEVEATVVGIALFYPRYSTWKGFCYYLEDLYVQPTWRGKGIGLALLRKLSDYALKRGAIRLDWQVIDWNSPAVEFYEKLGAKIEREWWNCKLKLDSQSLNQSPNHAEQNGLKG